MKGDEGRIEGMICEGRGDEGGKKRKKRGEGRGEGGNAKLR